MTPRRALAAALALFGLASKAAAIENSIFDLSNDRVSIQFDTAEWDADAWLRQLRKVTGRWEPGYSGLIGDGKLHASARVRRAAVAALGQSRTIDAVPKLMEVARDRREHPLVRGQAQHELLNLITPIHPIFVYKHGPQTRARKLLDRSQTRYAGLNLKEFQDMSRLTNERASELTDFIQEQLLVADVLACYNSDSSSEKLRAMNNFNSLMIRGNGSFYNEAADAMLDLLARDRDETVRAMAAKTFYGQFYFPIGHEQDIIIYLTRPETTAVFSIYLNDRNPNVAVAFAELFQHFGQLKSVGLAADPSLQKSRLNALADAYFDVMIEGLTSQHLDVRSLVVKGFEQFRETLGERFNEPQLAGALRGASARESDPDLKRGLADLVPASMPAPY